MDHKKHTIMVIEDEELLLQAIDMKLKMNGFNTVSCTGGKQALDYLKSIEKVPDAIWLDYYLKDMNGLEFMQEVKQHDKWKKIPVIVVSNSASSEKVHNMLELGVQSYVLKAEHRLDNIIESLQNLLKQKDLPQKEN